MDRSLRALVAPVPPGHEGIAAKTSSELRPGSDATRELERSAAFLGAQFASEGATGFDIAALLLELRDVVGGMVSTEDAASLTRLFEWLTVVALDTFAASGLQSLRERVNDQLEVGTPVVELLPKVPAVFLVGAASASVVDNLLSRAWMLAVGTGAPCLIIECTGLAEVGNPGIPRGLLPPSASERAISTDFETGYQAFLAQAEGSALQILLSGARRPLRDRVIAATTAVGLAIQQFERVDSAVAHALERAGYAMVRRP